MSKLEMERIMCQAQEIKVKMVQNILQLIFFASVNAGSYSRVDKMYMIV